MEWIIDKGRPICPQICEQLCARIATGEFAPRQRLMSVREVAVAAAVNPNTVQRAYAELESEGYTYSVPGKGSFAASRGEADQARRAELVEKFRSLTGELLGLGLSREELEALVKEVVS